MNTPSKEAREAAKEFRATIVGLSNNSTDKLATVIDRHFEPLRQRANQAEARVIVVENERREYWRERLVADGEMVPVARVKELEGQIERITAHHAKAALKIGVMQTDNAELAGALRDVRASFLGLQPDFGGPVAAQMGKAIERINTALARHAAGEPVVFSEQQITDAFVASKVAALEAAARKEVHP